MLQMLQCFEKNVESVGKTLKEKCFGCCRDVNKRCKCARFPKTREGFALLHLCVELIETICSLFAT